MVKGKSLAFVTGRDARGDVASDDGSSGLTALGHAVAGLGGIAAGARSDSGRKRGSQLLVEPRGRPLGQAIAQ